MVEKFREILADTEFGIVIDQFSLNAEEYVNALRKGLRQVIGGPILPSEVIIPRLGGEDW